MVLYVLLKSVFDFNKNGNMYYSTCSNNARRLHYPGGLTRRSDEISVSGEQMHESIQNHKAHIKFTRAFAK